MAKHTITPKERKFLLESARIEGYELDRSYLSPAEMLVYSNGDKAFTFLMAKCKETAGVLYEQDFLKAHALLMKDLLPKTDCGAWRTGYVQVGSHIPPKPEFIPGMMMAYIESFNRREETAGYYHAWFETIHPFRDGNGRIGRILWAYDLMRHGLEVHPYLDNFGEPIPEEFNSDKPALFYEKRTKYYESLNSFRAK